MPSVPSTRSVRIPQDERGGWSSDRPRRDGAPERPANIAVRCRVLRPTDRMRYSPGSMLFVVSPSAEERDRFVARLIENKASLLSLDRVRDLLAGRVGEDELEDRAQELLDAAASKRLAAGETVVIAAENGLDVEERERFTRMASSAGRPRHILLVEPTSDQVPEDMRGALNDLRRRLDSGALGEEGFQTALRLSGDSIGELKRIVFRPAPRDE